MPNDDKDIWQTYAKGVRRISPQGRWDSLPLEGRVREGGERPGTLIQILKPISKLHAPSPNPEWHVHFLSLPHSLHAQRALKGRGVLPLSLQDLTHHTILNRRTERALRQGAIQIDAKLDLHGMTQVEAYNALDRFMTAQVKRGHRNLLVITGKGGVASGGGVLRTNLPQWLETFPTASHILKLCPAAPKHGGLGAFYVILKRRRD